MSKGDEINKLHDLMFTLLPVFYLSLGIVTSSHASPITHCDGVCIEIEKIEKIDNPPINIIGEIPRNDPRLIKRCEDGGCTGKSNGTGSGFRKPTPDEQKYIDDMNRRKAAAEKARLAQQEYNRLALDYLRHRDLTIQSDALEQAEFEQKYERIKNSAINEKLKNDTLFNTVTDFVVDEVFAKMTGALLGPVTEMFVETLQEGIKNASDIESEPFDMVRPEDMNRLRIMLEKDNAHLRKKLQEQNILLKKNEQELGLPSSELIDPYVDPSLEINRGPASVQLALIAVVKSRSEETGNVIEQLIRRANYEKYFPMPEKDKIQLRLRIFEALKPNTCIVSSNSSCYLNTFNSIPMGKECFCPIDSMRGLEKVVGKSTRKPPVSYCETEFGAIKMNQSFPLGVTCINYISDPVLGFLPVKGKMVTSPCVVTSVPLGDGEECVRE